MIPVALLFSTVTALSPTCARSAVSRPAEAFTPSVRHVFQNGYPFPLRLSWIDAQGKRVDLGTLAPGGYRSIRTFAGHTFALTDPKGRCRRMVRIDDVFTGSYIGTSRYRAIDIRRGWHVLIDRALDPDAEPARTALATIARMLEQAEAALPPAALAQVRTTPIFLHDHAGPGGMFHPDPDWLMAHGRTVEMLNGIEVSNAGVFIETARVQPGAILHELTHAYYIRLSDEDRAEIEATYRRAVDSRRYLGVKRHDGSVVDAYARSNAAEYFAELSEAYFSRNDFFPFTRNDLAAYDPDGERLIAKLWR